MLHVENLQLHRRVLHANEAKTSGRSVLLVPLHLRVVVGQGCMGGRVVGSCEGAGGGEVELSHYRVA